MNFELYLKITDRDKRNIGSLNSKLSPMLCIIIPSSKQSNSRSCPGLMAMESLSQVVVITPVWAKSDFANPQTSYGTWPTTHRCALTKNQTRTFRSAGGRLIH